MKKLFIPLLLFLFLLPSIWSLLHPGFFLSDDGEWMVIRFSAFHQALADGQFPVRFLSRLNHGYGYPVANFLYPGFMYIGELIHLLGFGFVDTIKIILGLSMALSGVFTYFWLSHRFDKVASLIGSLFYVYMPYHLFDLYKRGSVGEVLALAVVPFIFWMIERKSFLFASLGIGFLIISHNTLAILFIPVTALYMILRKKELSLKIYQYIGILVVGILLASFFWFPAVFDLRYTRFFQTQVSNWQDHFATFELLGQAAVFVFLGAVFSTWKKKDRSIPLLFLAIASVAAFLSLPMSNLFWQILPVSFIQFPFRFLSIVVLSVAFLSAYTTSQLKGQVRNIVAIALLVLLGVSAIPFLNPQTFFDKGDSYYVTNEDSTTVQNEYMPKWVRQIPIERSIEKVQGAQVENVMIKSNKISFQTAMIEGGVIRINTIYFPGWGAFIDGKKVNIFYENEKGLMNVVIPKGQHKVLLQFDETPVRLASDVISLIALFTLSIFAIRKRVI